MHTIHDFDLVQRLSNKHHLTSSRNNNNKNRILRDQVCVYGFLFGDLILDFGFVLPGLFLVLSLSLSLTSCECDAILMKHGNQALHWFVCLLLCQLAWAMNGKDPFYSKTCAKFSARLKSGCAEKINKNPKRTDKKHSNYWSFYMFLLILCCFNKLNCVALNFRQSFMFVPDSWKLKPIVQFHWILFVAE